jgi:peptidoglycan/xylan/chitin deacetylase (PgdA/CDA1 family)
MKRKVKMSDDNSAASAVYAPNRSFPAKLARRLVQLRVVSPLLASPRRPIVSFTFDDFPRSAATTGADIIESFDGRATYYACSSLAGQEGVSGKFYLPRDIQNLQRAGHEIAAHTHSHIDCRRTRFEKVIADIDSSQELISGMGDRILVRHFAYPFGETTVRLKRALMSKYSTARGIIPGLNRFGSDLMQLRAFELSPEEWRIQRAERAVELAARTSSWVIFFTHDVSDEPSAYGTTPAVLRRLIQRCRDAGVSVLPVGQAFDETIRGQA